ncbi:MAG: tRNA pseudouridine(38-40) synthase TruA [Anaerolineae bacterium]|nr:tRNA pseudouridine(38-40) synthase TruA [Anaerolineae bacterium]
MTAQPSKPLRCRATLAYDGTHYQGFQRQAGSTPTIQLAVEQAVARVTGQEVTVIGAGRTDAGVHAVGQVIAFDVLWKHTEADLLRALNAVLPDDIALQDLSVQPGFHPRFDARSRIYTYTVVQAAQRQPLLRQQAWRIWSELDLDGMQAAAALLVGEHDFATFGTPPVGRNTVRTVIQSAWTAENQAYGRCLIYTIEANAFLQHMLRRIVGMLVDVGRRVIDRAQFETAFRAADLAQSGTVAPPQGLVLEKVIYEDAASRVPDEIPLD